MTKDFAEDCGSIVKMYCSGVISYTSVKVLKTPRSSVKFYGNQVRQENPQKISDVLNLSIFGTLMFHESSHVYTYTCIPPKKPKTKRKRLMLIHGPRSRIKSRHRKS